MGENKNFHAWNSALPDQEKGFLASARNNNRRTVAWLRKVVYQKFLK